MQSSSLLVKFIDQLVPEGYLELDQYDIILRSRITAGFLILSAFMSFYIGFMSGKLNPVIGNAIHIGQWGSYAFGAVYLLIILVFRFTGAFCVVANMYAVACYGAMYFSALTFGANIENPLALFLLMVPMVTFIISGKYTALFWTLLNIITFITVSRYPPAQLTVELTPEIVELLRIATWISLSIGFFAILYFYDIVNAKLRFVISEERNHFEFEAGHDKLTGLLNRASFQQRLKQSVTRVKTNKTSAIVGLIDLDGFKPVNDQIGHHAGDIVLTTVSRRLQESMRKTDTLARLGGDEFAFILQDIKDDASIHRIVTAMLDALAEPITIDEHTVQISGSIGLARCPEDREEGYDVLRAADVAMYDAKKTKGRYRYFHDVQVAAETPGDNIVRLNNSESR